MNQLVHNKLVSFIWSIADDCLRDIYVRGRYRNVILPMLVLRRLDALLEPSKEEVLKELEEQRELLDPGQRDEGGLEAASGYSFYNTSQFTLVRLCRTATNDQNLLLQNFIDYLNGYSDNVKEIIDKFSLRIEAETMARNDIWALLIIIPLIFN